LFRHALIVFPFGIAATANPPTTAAVTRHDTTATMIRERIPAPSAHTTPGSVSTAAAIRPGTNSNQGVPIDPTGAERLSHVHDING
jgi:hypothetical protein